MKTLNLTLLFYLLILSVPGFAQHRIKLSGPQRALLTVGANGELTAKNIRQGRNMAEYDQGGHFDCREFATGDRGVCNMKQVRDFIWSHWTGKKRGYIRLSGDSVDMVSTSHIFIEPGKDGEWHLAWRIARWSALPGTNQQIDDVPDLAKVERVDSKEGGDWVIIISNKFGRKIYTVPEPIIRWPKI